MDDGRRAAHLAAYALFEAVQSEQHDAAVAALPAAVHAAQQHGWDDVALVLAAVDTVRSLARPDGEPPTPRDIDPLVQRAEDHGAPALLAVTLGLRALAAAVSGDTAALMADGSRAVALLADPAQPAADRATGYVVAAAAFNTLRLWELVDELYTQAAQVEADGAVDGQASAIAVNRVLIRLEWAVALLENGADDEYALRLAQAAEAVGPALARPLPTLWRRDVEACATVVALLGGAAPADLPVADQRAALVAADDVEVLPLLDAATAHALFRVGDLTTAAVAAERLAPGSSASSGSRSFPSWVRAQVLAGREPTTALRAQQQHAALVSRLRWESRLAVLAAARAQIAAELRRDEHDRLSRAVNTDPLTGLHNRRTFDSWLSRRSGPRQRPAALMLVDLDDFKAVNDTLGHDFGDEVLRRFGRLLLTSVRPGDLAVRHGGDEFAVLLEDEHLTVGAARQRAVELRAAIDAEPWSDLAAGLVVSASIGMAVAAPGDGGTNQRGVDAHALYRSADAALYAAKGDGAGLVVEVLRRDGSARRSAVPAGLADAG